MISNRKPNIDLSILIATLNAEKYIVGCLKSIQTCFELHQNQKYEVIVKDGGSSDATREMVDSFSDQMPVQFIYSKDNGIYSAMNQEIELAKGKWLYFMGADDRLLPDFNTLLNEAKNGDAHLIYADAFLKHEGRVYDGEFTLEKLFKMPPAHQGTLFKKELFSKYGKYNTEYFICGDYERFLFFFSRPEIKINYIPRTVSIFNDAGFSRSGPKDLSFARDRYRLILDYFNYDEFDTKLKRIVSETKRHDAIMLIDYKKHLTLALWRYVSTIRISENPFKHIRYLGGSIKNFLFGS